MEADDEEVINNKNDSKRIFKWENMGWKNI